MSQSYYQTRGYFDEEDGSEASVLFPFNKSEGQQQRKYLTKRNGVFAAVVIFLAACGASILVLRKDFATVKTSSFDAANVDVITASTAPEDITSTTPTTTTDVTVVDEEAAAMMPENVSVPATSDANPIATSQSPSTTKKTTTTTTHQPKNDKVKPDLAIAPVSSVKFDNGETYIKAFFDKYHLLDNVTPMVHVKQGYTYIKNMRERADAPEVKYIFSTLQSGEDCSGDEYSYGGIVAGACLFGKVVDCSGGNVVMYTYDSSDCSDAAPSEYNVLAAEDSCLTITDYTYYADKGPLSISVGCVYGDQMPSLEGMNLVKTFLGQEAMSQCEGSDDASVADCTLLEAVPTNTCIPQSQNDMGLKYTTAPGFAMYSASSCDGQPSFSGEFDTTCAGSDFSDGSGIYSKWQYRAVEGDTEAEAEADAEDLGAELPVAVEEEVAVAVADADAAEATVDAVAEEAAVAEETEDVVVR